MNDLDILRERFPDTDILVFDKNGFCIYPCGEDITLTDSRNNGDMCLAVTDGDRFLGAAAIPDPSFAEYSKAFDRLARQAESADKPLSVLPIALKYLPISVKDYGFPEKAPSSLRQISEPLLPMVTIIFPTPIDISFPAAAAALYQVEAFPPNGLS